MFDTLVGFAIRILDAIREISDHWYVRSSAVCLHLDRFSSTSTFALFYSSSSSCLKTDGKLLVDARIAIPVSFFAPLRDGLDCPCPPHNRHWFTSLLEWHPHLNPLNVLHSFGYCNRWLAHFYTIGAVHKWHNHGGYLESKFQTSPPPSPVI